MGFRRRRPPPARRQGLLLTLCTRQQSGPTRRRGMWAGKRCERLFRESPRAQAAAQWPEEAVFMKTMPRFHPFLPPPLPT